MGRARALLGESLFPLQAALEAFLSRRVSWALCPQSRTLSVLFPAFARRAKRSVNAPIEQAVSR
jgi:hypothetical protein